VKGKVPPRAVILGMICSPRNAKDLSSNTCIEMENREVELRPSHKSVRSLTSLKGYFRKKIFLLA
jgi:hypothetical protein